MLINSKVKSKEMTLDMANKIKEDSQIHYPHQYLEHHIQGSTYIPFNDSIHIQIADTSENPKVKAREDDYKK